MMQAELYGARQSIRPTVNPRWAEKVLLTLGLVLLDMVMVGTGFLLAYLLRFESSIAWTYQHEQAPLYFYQQLVFLLIPAMVVIFKVSGLYEFKNLFGGMGEYAKIFNASTLAIMLVIVYSFFQPDFTIARAWLIMSWLFVAFFMSSGRFALRRAVYHLRANGRFLTPVIVIGADQEGEAIVQQLQSNAKAGVWIAGFLDDELEPGTEVVDGIPVLGPVDSVAALTRQYGVQDVIISSNALPREKLLKIFQTFGVTNDINVRLSSGLYEMMTTGVEVQEMGNVPLLSINKVRLTGFDIFFKRSMDIILSAMGILVTLPIMAVIGVMVKLDSSGPALHRRRVIGVGGKSFDALKFRTMRVDGDEMLARDYPEMVKELEENGKLKDDPRITKLGNFLRKTSLDELPQFFNVLLGQMSLVGPRMITEAERAKYGKWRTNLVTVKPGITGLWQVSGRSDLDYDDRVRLDMHYIRNYSIWFDIYLLWQTVPAVLKKRGAY